ncbi:MAG: Hint domain-containing protein [Sedimentitalea sp.]|nr:Hint domain-containing protein [Sedimentitalea sp.]
MLLNHTQAFADFQPAKSTLLARAVPMPKRTEISAFTAGTMLETEAGWTPANAIKPGDKVYTLDGGFAEVTDVITRQIASGTVQHWHVPATALNNCSDLLLTAGQHIAMIEPEVETLFQTHCVLVPVAAMAGFRGIRPVTGYSGAQATELRFDSEEIVYAQTGTLLHVSAGETEPFFRTLNYGETRALLSLMNRGHCAPDPRGFAPSLAA